MRKWMDGWMSHPKGTANELQRKRKQSLIEYHCNENISAKWNNRPVCIVWDPATVFVNSLPELSKKTKNPDRKIRTAIYGRLPACLAENEGKRIRKFTF